MVTRETLREADMLDVIITDETPNCIFAIVGYKITYFKKKEKFVCNCKGKAVYGLPTCKHFIKFVRECKQVPEKFREDLERQEKELIKKR